MSDWRHREIHDHWFRCCPRCARSAPCSLWERQSSPSPPRPMADSPPVAVAVAVDEQEHQTATAATAEQPAPLADDSSSSSSSDVALAPSAAATPTDDGTPAPESLAARAEVLLMCRSLDATLAALGGSTRVRYTALDASRTLLVFGANTGSLYVFNRASLELIRLVSSAEIRGAVVRIAISPIDESLVAVATAQHLLVILQLNIHERAQKEKLVYKVEQHKVRPTLTHSLVKDRC